MKKVAFALFLYGCFAILLLINEVPGMLGGQPVISIFPLGEPPEWFVAVAWIFIIAPAVYSTVYLVGLVIFIFSKFSNSGASPNSSRSLAGVLMLIVLVLMAFSVITGLLPQ